MRTLLAAVSLLAVGCAHAPAAPASASPAAVAAAPDRSEADRALDPGRKPQAFLEFLKVEPGMKVGELFAGGGYTTELLARSVGPSGVVFAENPAWVLEKFAGKPWAERLAKPVNRNVVRADQELETPFPAGMPPLDLVVSNANYHDAVWRKVDRARMNGAVKQALKPAGRYVVCDSSAKPGSGPEAASTLHRIDEQIVRDEVTAAGFQVLEEGDFLRNPEDHRDWNASPVAAGEKRGTSDRFCLAFRNPG